MSSANAPGSFQSTLADIGGGVRGVTQLNDWRVPALLDAVCGRMILRPRRRVATGEA